MLYNFYCFIFNYLKQLDPHALIQRVICTGVYAGCLRCKYYWLLHLTGLCCLVILIRKKIDSIIWGGGWHVLDFREQFFFLSDLLCSFSFPFFQTSSVHFFSFFFSKERCSEHIFSFFFDLDHAPQMIPFKK